MGPRGGRDIQLERRGERTVDQAVNEMNLKNASVIHDVALSSVSVAVYADFSRELGGRCGSNEQHTKRR
jgi:hypothetical protein